jgi:glutamyl-tRNA reductase
MCAEELDRYLAVSSAREVAPLVSQLHEQAEAVRVAELDRLRARLGDLDERQLEALDALTKGIVAKLLHSPTVRLKDAAGTPRGERLAEALRDLFEL